MKTKNESPFALIQEKDLSVVLNVYYKINQLKHLYRQGWLRFIAEDKCESVADHIFGVTILSFMLNNTYKLNLNVEKIAVMAILHEMGEVKNGDITPFDGISKEDKHRMEKEGVIELFKDLPNSQDYVNIWDEFEKRETKEARFVFQVEKLEMAIQAKIYEGLYGGDLSEFQIHVEKLISDNLLHGLLHEL